MLPVLFLVNFTSYLQKKTVGNPGCCGIARAGEIPIHAERHQQKTSRRVDLGLRPAKGSVGCDVTLRLITMEPKFTVKCTFRLKNAMQISNSNRICQMPSNRMQARAFLRLGMVWVCVRACRTKERTRIKENGRKSELARGGGGASW